MTHGSLFSGIGGFDLAAEWAGFTNLFNCEWEEFPRKVLKHHFPNAEQFGDITTANFCRYRGKIDILSGGFPCQDASIAKQDKQGQKGLQGTRTGLWYHMLRAISEIEPKFVVAENVSNILRTNEGDDFRIILEGLSGLGYNAEWRVCRGSEVGAPHHRARVFLVAYSPSIKLQKSESFFKILGEKISQRRRLCVGTTASIGISWDAQPEVCWLDDGLSPGLVGFTKERNESIKAYGNAIVPQVAYRIFESIQDYEKRKKSPPPCEELPSHHRE